MLSKGDIMINPKTSRPIKVASRTWLKLVKEGVIEGAYKDPKELYVKKESDDDKSMEEMKIKLDEELPEHEQAVKGRGKYKNKIIKRSKPLTQKTVERFTENRIRKRSEQIQPELIDEESDNEDLDTFLNRLIENETKGRRKKKPPPPPRSKTRRLVRRKKRKPVISSSEEEYESDAELEEFDEDYSDYSE